MNIFENTGNISNFYSQKISKKILENYIFMSTLIDKRGGYNHENTCILSSKIKIKLSNAKKLISLSASK